MNFLRNIIYKKKKKTHNTLIKGFWADWNQNLAV